MPGRVYDKVIKQKNLLWKRSLPWPGFEPGLLRPQRNVLTTIRSRRCALFERLLSICPHVSWSIVTEICSWSEHYADALHLFVIIYGLTLIHLPSLCCSRNCHWVSAYFFLTFVSKIWPRLNQVFAASSVSSPSLAMGGFNMIQRRKELI